MDVRLPIGILFAGIGALLIAAGLFTAPELQKLASTGFNLNLVWGAVLLVFGGGSIGLALRAKS
jgi:hypothetical protein